MVNCMLTFSQRLFAGPNVMFEISKLIFLLITTVNIDIMLCSCRASFVVFIVNGASFFFCLLFYTYYLLDCTVARNLMLT